MGISAKCTSKNAVATICSNIRQDMGLKKSKIWPNGNSRNSVDIVEIGSKIICKDQKSCITIIDFLMMIKTRLRYLQLHIIFMCINRCHKEQIIAECQSEETNNIMTEMYRKLVQTMKLTGQLVWEIIIIFPYIFLNINLPINFCIHLKLKFSTYIQPNAGHFQVDIIKCTWWTLESQIMLIKIISCQSKSLPVTRLSYYSY